MLTKKKNDIIILGITLFAMFFGAGNLIFPAFLGFESRSNFLMGFLGFSSTSIFLPMIAMNVIVKRNGLKKLGDSIAPWFSSLLTFLIYVTIGPLLAIPRTSSTSFSIAVEPFIKNVNHLQMYIIIYSIIFFSLSVLIALKPDKLSIILGKITAPLLILLIIIIFFSTVFTGVDPSSMSISKDFLQDPFFKGFLDGYQTMDTIAALNFGIIFIVNVKAMGYSESTTQKSITLKASIIAGSLLFIIYLFLGLIGNYSSLENAINGTTILTYAVESKFGLLGMIVLAIVFILACFNTCTALITCVSQYFTTLIPNISYKKWVIFFAVSSAIISNAGLNTILKFSIPILSIIYPISITLIVIGFFNLDSKENYNIARKLMIIFVTLFSIIPVALNLMNLSNVLDFMPLNKIGLVWVLPCAFGFIIGLVAHSFSRIELKKE